MSQARPELWATIVSAGSMVLGMWVVFYSLLRTAAKRTWSKPKTLCLALLVIVLGPTPGIFVHSSLTIGSSICLGAAMSLALAVWLLIWARAVWRRTGPTSGTCGDPPRAKAA